MVRKKNNVHPVAGTKFSRLTVVKCWVEGEGRFRRSKVLCVCECGVSKVVQLSSLRNGDVKSCGCFRLSILRTANLKHGDSSKGVVLKPYQLWLSIRERCNNPKNKSYHLYGGRGITVCDEWNSSYATFKNWFVNSEYKEGLQIDRIDNNKGYSPENCRFVTCIENQNNRRTNRTVTFLGRTQNVTQWANEVGLPRGMIYQRLDLGWSVEEAFTTPKDCRRKQAVTSTEKDDFDDN